MTTLSQQQQRQRNVAAFFGALTAIVACLFANLGAFGLVGPDEPRYAWIARAMAQTGDWITPRLYGQPWFEKPILYYWAAAAGFHMHLTAEWAARLPSSFAALAAALAIAWLALKHYGLADGFTCSSVLFAPLVFCASVAAIGFARAATPDMLFSATLALAMASAAGVLRHSRALRSAASVSAQAADAPRENHSDYFAIAFFGFWLGLAVLAKGPAAVILAGGAMAFWALATRQWRAVLRLAHPLAIAVFCAMALPWYIACALRNPTFLRVFILQHNFERYLTPVFMHRQPFWFFVPIILLAVLPWTIFLWPAAKDGLQMWRERAWANSPGFFFACWAAFPILFFSFSESKLPGYILPSIPPLALLCSIAAARAVSRSRAFAWLLGAGLSISWIILSGAGWHGLRHALASTPQGAPGWGMGLTVGVLLLSAILLAAAARQDFPALVGVNTFAVAIAVVGAGIYVLPRMDGALSARPYADFFSNDLRPDRVFIYKVPRSMDYGLAFYAQRVIPEWSPADPSAALVITTPAGFAEIEQLGRFHGSLDEPFSRAMFVPIAPEPQKTDQP